jgi:hypothetical protein
MRTILAAFVFFLVCHSNAEARRGSAIVGFGEQVSPVAELPDETFGEGNLGLYYNSFRVFLVPLVTWDKRYVLYKADAYAELEPDGLAEIKETTGSLIFKGNLWVKWVNYLWPVLLLGFIVFQRIRMRQLARLDEEFAHLR